MTAPKSRRMFGTFFAQNRRAMSVRYICLCLTLALLGGCFSSDASVGVVDSASVVQDGAPGRNAVAHLTQVREVLQGNLNAIVKKLESYPDKQQAQQILQAAQSSLQQTLDAHESQINALLTEALQAAVRECRDAKKLSVMVSKDTVLDYDPALNVTPDVLAIFDKKAVQLPIMPVAVADPQLPPPNKPAAAKPVVEEKPKQQEPAPAKAEPRKRQNRKDDKRR